MVFLGIDPGKSGFAVAINEDGTVDSIPYSEDGYAKFFSGYGKLQCKKFAVVERDFSSPQMGVRSAFSFGENYGFIRALLSANNIPYECILPNKWKKHFGVTHDKNTSIMCAQRLFPTVDLRASDKCRKPHDGKAEALLMAEYGRRTYSQNL